MAYMFMCKIIYVHTSTLEFKEASHSLGEGLWSDNKRKGLWSEYKAE